jgi:hypothetical protein
MFAAFLTGFMMKLGIVLFVTISFVPLLATDSVVRNLTQQCTAAPDATIFPLFRGVVESLWPSVLLLPPLFLWILSPRLRHSGKRLLDYCLICSSEVVRMELMPVVCLCCQPLACRTRAKCQWLLTPFALRPHSPAHQLTLTFSTCRKPITCRGTSATCACTLRHPPLCRHLWSRP